MISTKIALSMTGAALAVGLVAGGAGTIVARDGGTGTTTAADCLEHMQQYGAMMGTGSGMMGTGSGMMNQGGTAMPDWMLEHHGVATPEPTR